MNRFLTVVCIALSAFVFISCDKDDDDVSGDKLVGTWRMTDIYCNDGETTTTFLGIPIEGTFTWEGTEFNTTTTFTENPNEFVSEGSYTVLITTDIGGQVDTEEQEISFNGGTGTWELDGNTLHQTYADTTTAVKILELTDDVLKTELKLDATINDPLTGFSITTKGTVISTFEKE